MDDFHEITDAARHLNVGLKSGLFELLGILLADAAVDAEVVARELELSDATRERLRRSLDRIVCAQSVLEAMRELLGPEREPAGKCGSGQTNRDNDGDHSLGTKARVRGAVELLAEGWSQDYPDGAVEWLLFESEDKNKTM